MPSRPRKEVKYDCRVILENGRYFLIKPEDRAIKRPDNQRLPVVALDPGVRTFQTIYSENIAGKFGESDFSRIYRLCYILDKLYSKRKKEHSNRYNRKKPLWCSYRHRFRERKTGTNCK